MLINDLYTNKKQSATEGSVGAKPGWMLKQDPELAKKVKDSKRGYEAVKKYAGKPVPKDQSVTEANDDTGVKWFDFTTWVLKQGDKYNGFTTNHTVHQAAQKAYKAYVSSQKQGVAEERGQEDYYYRVRQQTKRDIELEMPPKAWDSVGPAYATYEEAQAALEALQAKHPNERFTYTQHPRISNMGGKPQRVFPEGVSEEQGAPTVHRIGLTVTDPNHPMVSKRQEQYQKSVRVSGADREKAINSAIAHLRRKGYRVHDYHYMGTVDQGVAEAKKKKKKKSSRAMGGYFFPGYGYYGSGESGEGGGDGGGESVNRSMTEVSLGDYRKKATVSRALAQTNQFFGRDDPAAVAAADRTIANRTKGLASADARRSPYTPPAQDAEKQQRDLTARYPNIDELVAKAEQRRDPNYDYAEGDAYYRGREAEQHYQRLKQIQRVIQGLNESLNRSHLP